MNKPKFNPNAAYEPVSEKGSKPKFDPSAEYETAPDSGEETSTMDAVLTKGAQGLTLGFADEIGGGLQAGYRKLTGDKRDLSDIYKTERDQYRAHDKKVGEDSPVASFLAELAGGMLMPGGGLVKGAKGAAMLGGLYGLGKSEAEVLDGDIAGAAQDTAVGAAVGGLIAKGGEKLGKLVRGGADGAADAMAARTASPTPRDMLIWKGQPGGVRGVGRSIRESGKLKPFQAVDDLAEGLDDAVSASGKNLEALRGGEITADGREVAKRLWQDTVGATKGQTPLRHQTAEAKREFVQLMKRDLYDRATGEYKDIPLAKLQELKKGYRKKINFDSAAAASGGGRKNLMPASQELRAGIGRSLERVQENSIARAGGPKGPQALTQYRGEKVNYGNLSQAAGSANRAAAKDATKLPISPYDLGAGALAAGSGGLPALVGAVGVKLARSRGGTTAAWSLDKVAKFANSPTSGKFGRVLSEAYKRGKPALAATHHVLLKSSPEYRKQMEQGEQEPEQE